MAKKASSGKGAARGATKDLESRLIGAMLDIAEREGWEAVTLPAIAEAADAKLSELYPAYPSRMAVLGAFMRRIDREVVETDFEFTADDTARDRLFEVVMRRFDALRAHKEAVRRIRAGLMRDPAMSAVTMQQLGRSMAWMLEAAGLSAEGLSGKVKIAGLCGIWARCIAVWLDDDSPDMSRTMRELDRGLKRADRWAGVMFCRRRRPTREEGAQAA